MKKIALCVLIIGFSLAGSACAEKQKEAKNTAAQKATKEAVKPDPNLWDFGEVKQGEVAVHEFTLKNDTGKEFNIRNINTSCGCTASEASRKKLAAQEEAKIKVSFKSKGYNGDVAQFVYVQTDSIEKPVVRFTIKARVIKEK